jgi:hypothetical protein
MIVQVGCQCAGHATPFPANEAIHILTTNRNGKAHAIRKKQALETATRRTHSSRCGTWTLHQRFAANAIKTRIVDATRERQNGWRVGFQSTKRRAITAVAPSHFARLTFDLHQRVD